MENIYVLHHYTSAQGVSDRPENIGFLCFFLVAPLLLGVHQNASCGRIRPVGATPALGRCSVGENVPTAFPTLAAWLSDVL
jgi:hypothetical protein